MKFGFNVNLWRGGIRNVSENLFAYFTVYKPMSVYCGSARFAPHEVFVLG
jgi:hypothetical protein